MTPEFDITPLLALIAIAAFLYYAFRDPPPPSGDEHGPGVGGIGGV